jgi:hypothetical protein
MSYYERPATIALCEAVLDSPPGARDRRELGQRDRLRRVAAVKRQLKERGTHDELLAAGGLYAELYQTQFARRPARSAGDNDGKPTMAGQRAVPPGTQGQTIAGAGRPRRPARALTFQPDEGSSARTRRSPRRPAGWSSPNRGHWGSPKDHRLRANPAGEGRHARLVPEQGDDRPARRGHRRI